MMTVEGTATARLRRLAICGAGMIVCRPFLQSNAQSGLLTPMTVTIFQDINGSLRHLYLEDERPWFVGFSGGKLDAINIDSGGT
jgi:hypothetical protein